MADKEEILTRHKKEKKELVAKIQALKKSSGKKKKEVTEEVAKLEQELLEKHTQELANLDLNKETEEKPVENEEKPTFVKEDKEPRISKAQKRRDKKAQAEKEREQLILEGEEENKHGPRNKEQKAINKILSDRGLKLFSIPSDGDCLYNAIKHQLTVHGLAHYEVPKLRELTANYIQKNKDSLICYMTNPKTDEILNDTEFEDYCEAVRSTKAWGGQVEIQAISSVLKVKIEVLQATGSPTIQGSEFGNPGIVLAYHRFLYNLGEHYNSTIPRSMVDDSDDED